MDHVIAVLTAYKHFNDENDFFLGRSLFFLNSEPTALRLSKIHFHNMLFICEPYIHKLVTVLIAHVSGKSKQDLTWLTSFWSINMSEHKNYFGDT